MKRYLALLLLLVTTVGAVSCSRGSNLPRVDVVFVAPSGAESKLFTVEVVATRAERARGLMYRKEMGPREGMLFVFDRPAVHTFWMKNTFIPLDMVFLSAEGKIVGMLEDVAPLTETGRSVDAESLYVLEFLAGTMREHGVKTGHTARILGALPRAESE